MQDFGTWTRRVCTLSVGFGPLVEANSRVASLGNMGQLHARSKRLISSLVEGSDVSPKAQKTIKGLAGYGLGSGD